jgi:hypothetical protein
MSTDAQKKNPHPDDDLFSLHCLVSIGNKRNFLALSYLVAFLGGT